MLKTLSKILLSQNQRCLLGLEDSNLLTNQKCEKVETQEPVSIKIINSTSFDDIFGSQNNSNAPYATTTPLDHDHLPNYLSKSTSPEFRLKIENLINNFANEKANSQNMKILKLAYGFMEDPNFVNDENSEDHDHNPQYLNLKTEESSNALFSSHKH